MPETVLCTICGDVAVGRNYGALSCFGCKAFFQRSVRKGLVYACRFRRDCAVEKKRRNQCRYCRYQKCFKFGMKKEAVQDERDKISFSYSTNESALASPPTLDPLLLSNPFKVTVSKLLEAESLASLFAKCMKGPIYDKNYFTGADGKVDITEIKIEAKKKDILFYVEWAKNVPSFKDLDRRDQLALLRAHAGELLILDVMKRSVNAPEGVLVFSNGFPMNQKTEMTPIKQKLLEDVLKPLKSIQISDREIICLKALVLLDPNGVDLREPDRVKDMRYQVQLMLEDFIMEQPFPQARGRLSHMLLTLLPLYDFRSKMQYIFKLAKFWKISMGDRYIEELVNNESEITMEEINFICAFYCSDAIDTLLPLTRLAPNDHLNKESFSRNPSILHRKESFQLPESPPDDFPNDSTFPVPVTELSNFALMQAVTDILGDDDDDGIPPDLDFDLLNLPSPAAVDLFVREFN